MGEHGLSFSEAMPNVNPEPGRAGPSLPEIALTRAAVRDAEPPASRDNELSFDDQTPKLPAGLARDVKRAAAESEKTRSIVNAIVQLLVEEEVLSLDQIQSRVAKLRDDASGS